MCIYRRKLMFVVVVFLSPALRFKCESLKHNCMLFLFTFFFFFLIPLMSRQSIILLQLAVVSVSIGCLWMNGLSSAVFSCFVFDCVTKCRSMCLWLIYWLMIAYIAYIALLSRLTALAHEWLAFYSVFFKYALRKWYQLLRLAWQLFNSNNKKRFSLKVLFPTVTVLSVLYKHVVTNIE